tara:strand:+ start:1282 stop:1494 length:213 start_codon:yes stop_codon:yes gene_type:complete
MHKIYYMIIMLFIFSHCSIDTKSGLWENKNTIDNKKKSSEINFNKELTFDEFKENVILYGKNSKYPIITK